MDHGEREIRAGNLVGGIKTVGINGTGGSSLGFPGNGEWRLRERGLRLGNHGDQGWGIRGSGYPRQDVKHTSRTTYRQPAL